MALNPESLKLWAQVYLDELKNVMENMDTCKRHKYSDLYSRLISNTDPLCTEAANALDELARIADSQAYQILKMEKASERIADLEKRDAG